MTTTFSPNLRLSSIVTGELSGTWGDVTDKNICTLLEQAISGQAAVTHDNTANYTLTTANGATDEARQAILNIAGTLTAARNAVVPTVNKLYVAKNATVGGFSLVVKTSGGTGITIPNGNTAPLRCDGTNVLGMFDWLPSLTLGTTLMVGPGTLNYTALIYKSGVNVNYLQLANGSTGTAAGNGLLVGNDAAGLGVLNSQQSDLVMSSSGGERGRFTSTGLAVTGTLSATGIALNANAVSNGTSQNFIQLNNTGGQFYIGQESSVGGLFFAGSSAYDNVLYAVNPIDVIISGTKRAVFGSTGLAVTGVFSASDLISAGTPATTGHVISYESLTSVALPLQTRGSFYGYKTGANYYGISIRGGFDSGGNATGAIQVWSASASGTDRLTFSTTGVDVVGTLGVTGAATFGGTLGVTGTLTSNSTTGLIIQPSPNTTLKAINQYVTAGGTLSVGLDDAAGSQFGTAGNYGTVIYRPASTGFAISRGATTDLTISSAGVITIPGALTVNGAVTLTGSRTITTSTVDGNVRIRGDAGGWATVFGFLGSAGTDHGGFGALGSADIFTNFWIGPSYAAPLMTIAATGSSFSGPVSAYGNLTITGSYALRGSYGGGGVTSNLAVGDGAIASSATGTYNTGIGLYALNAVTSGDLNTAVGGNTLQVNTTGGYNTAVGVNALIANVGGSYNVAVGYAALASNTSGAGNTTINARTSAGIYAPVFDPTTENNRFCMGSTAVTNAYIQVGWTVVSDARDKTDFAPVPHGLDFVRNLQPTAYRYKPDREATEGHGPVRYGFKAQDVLALEGSNPVIVDAEDADKLRFNDQSLIAVLVNAIQELNAKFDAYVSSHP